MPNAILFMGMRFKGGFAEIAGTDSLIQTMSRKAGAIKKKQLEMG
jgi:hypothetical protein